MSLILNNKNNNFRNSLLPDIQRKSKILGTIIESNNIELNSKYLTKRMQKAKSNTFKIRKSKINFNTSQPITDLKNRKNSLYSKAKLNLNSENNNQIILQNRNRNDEYIHKTKISNLLNNAKEFFNNLENYLQIRKTKTIQNKIIKRQSRKIKKEISYPKVMKNKENDIDKLYGRMYNIKILNDEAKNDNKNISLTMKKSISSYNIENNYINYNNANSKNKEATKKLYSDQIVQTFNEQDNIENDVNIEQKNINIDSKKTEHQKTEYNNIINKNHIINKNNNLIHKNILPNLNSNKYGYNDEFENNNYKIAEIKEIYPCYPTNRLLKIINNRNNNNNKHNKVNKLFFDFKNNYSRDNRYFYEQFMKSIKFDLSDIFGIKKKMSQNNSFKNIFI